MEQTPKIKPGYEVQEEQRKITALVQQKLSDIALRKWAVEEARQIAVAFCTAPVPEILPLRKIEPLDLTEMVKMHNETSKPQPWSPAESTSSPELIVVTLAQQLTQFFYFFALGETADKGPIT